MNHELDREVSGQVETYLDIVPAVLGAVAGTVTTDIDVLTGTVAGCLLCDACRDDAKA